MKEGFVLKSPGAEASEMEAINRYTRREYQPEEVYAFSLVLCDNEIDRDFERFSIPALEKLRELFLGKTCILDHERKSANQTARIFHTAVETEEGRLTQAGEPYTCLTARAYLPRTEKTRETVELIDSGILKEVSVSCAVKRSVCGICGKEQCGHQKGRAYGGKLCCRVLEEPTDAYECSFVAVPAQREAGVRKSALPVRDCLKGAPAQGVRLTAAQAGELSRKLEELEEQADWGRRYRQELEGDVLKYSGLIQPEVPAAVMGTVVKSLSLGELSQLGKAYRRMAGRAVPLRPQLAPEEPAGEDRDRGNSPYRI